MNQKKSSQKGRYPGIGGFLLHHLPALIYMGVIYYVSSLSRISPPSLGLGWEDKIYHFGEYAILAALVYWAIRFYTPKVSSIQVYVLAFLLCTLFAVSDEVHQIYVPGRESRVGDVIADVLGAAVALSIVALYLRRRSQKSID